MAIDTIAEARSVSAIELTAPRSAEIREISAPSLRPGHVLVRTAYVGLCGSDASMFDGSSVYLHNGMKQYPFIFGHEWSGVIAEVADDIYDLSAGDRVVGHNFITCETCFYCRAGRRDQCSFRSEMGILGDYPGAASELFLVPARVLAKLPPNLSLREAALLEPGSTALHAVTEIGVRDDDHVAVFGTGAMGLLVIQLAKYLGASVDAVGIDPAGLELATQLGADRAVQPAEVVAGSYTAAVEASGASAAAAQAVGAVGPAGRVALIGIVHRPVDGIDLSRVVINAIRIQGVLSGIEQWDRLISLASHGAIALTPLLDRTFSFRDAMSAFELLLEPNRRRPKILIEFNDPEAA